MRQIKKMTLGIGVLCIALLLVASATAVPVVQKQTATKAVPQTANKAQKKLAENKLFFTNSDMFEKVDVAALKNALEKIRSTIDTSSVLEKVDSSKIRKCLELLPSNIEGNLDDFNLKDFLFWIIGFALWGIAVGMVIAMINPFLLMVPPIVFPILAAILYIMGVLPPLDE